MDGLSQDVVLGPVKLEKNFSIIFSANMTINRQLPRYVAILRPTTMGSPSFQILESFHGVIMSELENADWVDLSTSLVLHSLPGWETGNFEILETKIRNAAAPVKYWFHQEYFLYNNERIPVVNFDSKDFLPMRYYPVKPSNQNENQLTILYDMYRRVLSRQQERIQNYVNAPAEIKSLIPAYVVDLIIQDRLQKKESCPITLTEFTDASRMAVTSCYHCFDTEALKQWVKTKDVCPVCRAKL